MPAELRTLRGGSHALDILCWGLLAVGPALSSPGFLFMFSMTGN